MDGQLKFRERLEIICRPIAIFGSDQATSEPSRQGQCGVVSAECFKEFFNSLYLSSRIVDGSEC